MIQFVSQVCAAVGGERLLPARLRRLDPRPHETHADRPARPSVSIPSNIPMPSANEPTTGGSSTAAAAAVGPVDRPQPGLRVEEAERHADHPAVVVGAELVLVAHPVEQRPRDARRPRTPPTRRSRPAAGAGAGCGRPSGRTGSRSRAPCRTACITSCIAPPFALVVSRERTSNRGRIQALYVCLTGQCAHADLAAARAAGDAPGAAAHDRPRDRAAARDRRPHRPALHRGAAGARHPRRGPARRRRRLPRAPRLPPAAADAERRRGGRRRARPDRRARARPLDGEAEPVDGALAKILRVLPAPLRSQVEALEQTLGFTAPPRSAAPVGGAVALTLADAIRRRRRVRFAYRSFSGEATRREVSPHGLVVHAGRWYLAAYDHGREDLRTFRVDRMTSAASTMHARRSRPPAEGFDAVAHVSLSLARVPWTWEVEVLLDLPLERGGRASPADARRARAGRRPDAAAHARQLARLDGRGARRARLRLRDPRAGRAPRERAALADRLAACA